MNILHLPFTINMCQAASSDKTNKLKSPFISKSVIPRVSGQVVSPKSFFFMKLSFQTNMIVENHFPQWNYTIP